MSLRRIPGRRVIDHNTQVEKKNPGRAPVRTVAGAGTVETMRGPRRAVIAVTGVIVAAGCGSASHASTPTTRRPAAVTSTRQPSKLAIETCNRRGADELQEAGLTVQGAVVPHWSPKAGLYSCSLSTAFGTLVLSVNEFPDVAAANQYYAGLERRAAVSQHRLGLEDADESFNVQDGSIVARKGTHVLTIDMRHMAPRLGVVPRAQPP